MVNLPGLADECGIYELGLWQDILYVNHQLISPSFTAGKACPVVCSATQNYSQPSLSVLITTRAIKLFFAVYVYVMNVAGMLVSAKSIPEGAS